MKAWMVAIGVAAAGPAWSQAPARHYDCNFTKIGGDETLQFSFVHDEAQRRAVMTGNAGMSEVLPLAGPELTSFVEVLATGAVQTTSIDRSGKAVHSRHTYLSRGEFFQSQWLGRCVRS